MFPKIEITQEDVFHYLLNCEERTIMHEPVEIKENGLVVGDFFEEGILMLLRVVSTEMKEGQQHTKVKVVEHDGNYIARNARLEKDNPSSCKKLFFNQDLFGAVISGEEQKTLRRYTIKVHDFTKDEIIVGVFGELLQVLLRVTKDSVKKPFNEITDEEAQSHGYHNKEQLIKVFQETYYQGKGMRPNDMAIWIFVEVMSIEGIPILSFKEEEE